ncbi:MAG: imidazole glycerol phosphate synthase subunit HisF [Piscinibacter sp.]|uniref:imidazole glycerol phosphate synthase subunit HisF n=1 Tax=Piscinibacter sp. TaxID=1903157 RepID=UPI003D0D633D
MLKVRVIPSLLWKGPGLVKGVGFNSWRRVGPVLPAIKVYNARDVDELVLLDIVASQTGEAPDYVTVADLSNECAVPLTVGGGICRLEQIVALLHAGADKVSINSSAVERPELINQAAAKFGAQCIVASIDARRETDDRVVVWIRSATQDTGRDPVEWARELADRGAGEILLTSIDRDGTMQGYDLQLIERVSAAIAIPVIASGGAGTYQHLVDAVLKAGASAVAAASMFHFTEQTPSGAKQALHAAGIPVRSTFVAGSG